MKKIIILLNLIPVLFHSQNIPEQYHFSQNGQKLIRGGVELNGFYDESEIKTINLYFDQEDYWDQLHDNYCDKINIPATLIYDGETYNEVGVRFKGQTSYANTNGGGGGPGGGGPGGGSVDTDKKSFNIELDWVHDQDIDSYETINLNNCYQDPSFLREFIFEKLSRKHIPASQVNFIELIINDQSWGLYPNIQQLDKQHAKEWFFDDECTRWRAEDPNSISPGCGGGGPGGGGPGGGGPGGGGPGGGGPDFGAGTSSLNYLGEDTSNYMSHYTLKRSYIENPWEDLVQACKVIEDLEEFDDPYNALNQHLDLDATLWHLANEIIFSDDDSYIHKGGMDYFIYFDKYNGRILPVEYDGNSVFGIQNANWSPFHNENDPDFVLMNKLFSVPKIRQRYLAHFRTILDESFDTIYINELIDNYFSLIDQKVLNDPKKIYSYEAFTNEINLLKNYFSQRSSYLHSLDTIDQQGVDIIQVEYSVGNNSFTQPSSFDEVVVSVAVDESNPVNELNLYFGTGLTGLFEKAPMNYSFATGMYNYTIPPQSSGQYVRFYVESISSDGTTKYSPKGAEHEVYIYKVKMDEIVLGNLVINEIMASNNLTVTDQNGEFDDWIEILNRGNQPINLSGYHITDDFASLDKFTFSNLLINPGEYYILWADNQEEQGLDSHLNFKLSSTGEELYISDENMNLIDGFSFGEQQTDKGYARIPNGNGHFVIQNSTFGYNNEQTTNILEFDNSNKEIIRKLDILGRNIKHTNQSVVVYIFADGSVEKKVLLK